MSASAVSTAAEAAAHRRAAARCHHCCNRSLPPLAVLCSGRRHSPSRPPLSPLFAATCCRPPSAATMPALSMASACSIPDSHPCSTDGLSSQYQNGVAALGGKYSIGDSGEVRARRKYGAGDEGGVSIDYARPASSWLAATSLPSADARRVAGVTVGLTALMQTYQQLRAVGAPLIAWLHDCVIA